uniref:Fcf2 pre-rRNA processing C-terminal domain-containing protein n=1 Tax=Guillardia theta TaxID=55529 RepID=A0A7S4H835_GUITH|mmetsp:Transcript_10027/g.33409  ORF Transcript_10027/g.33409 Transcript_10027/m.33409 type:complete len:613 (+) Transcript_10027:137-1975(+)
MLANGRMTKTWRRSWVCSSLFLVLILVPSRSFSWVNHETNTCRQANPRATVAPALLKLRGGKGRKKRGASSSEDKESSDGWASGEDSPSTSEEEKKKQAEPRGIPRRRGDRRSDSSDVGKASSDSGSSWEEGSERSEKSSQSTLSEDEPSELHVSELPEDVMERLAEEEEEAQTEKGSVDPSFEAMIRERHPFYIPTLEMMKNQMHQPKNRTRTRRQRITWRGQEIDPEDEYIDFFKYRVKWCPDKKFLRRQEQHRKLQPWMSHATKELLRLVLPLRGTRHFGEQVFKRYTDGKDENGRYIWKPDLPPHLKVFGDTIINTLSSKQNFTLPYETLDSLHNVDDKSSLSVKRALKKHKAEPTAGPRWFDLPKGPDLKSRPDLRADFKLLTERNTWDPKNRYKSLGWEKKGTTTKSPTKLEYPKYFAEGYYAIDPKHPWENLPKHLRFKSLTEQIMADDRIRRKIKERFHRQQKLAAEEKKLKGLTEKPTRPPRPPRPATGRSIMIQKSLKKIRAVQREGYDGEGPDPLADRELPKMPSMGGTGKPPTEEEIREERMQRLGIKYKKKPEPAQKKDMVVKKVEKKVKKKKKKRDPKRLLLKRATGKRDGGPPSRRR